MKCPIIHISIVSSWLTSSHWSVYILQKSYVICTSFRRQGKFQNFLLLSVDPQFWSKTFLQCMKSQESHDIIPRVQSVVAFLSEPLYFLTNQNLNLNIVNVRYIENAICLQHSNLLLEGDYSHFLAVRNR